jgi:hypothetical protein
VQFQDRARDAKFVLLLSSQSREQVVGRLRHEALEIPLQEHLRPFRVLVEQRCRGGEGQDLRIAGVLTHRFFGDRQKAGRDLRVGESLDELILPGHQRADDERRIRCGLLDRDLCGYFGEGKVQLRHCTGRHGRRHTSLAWLTTNQADTHQPRESEANHSKG